jgi:PAS domain S-box-containing protein
MHKLASTLRNEMEPLATKYCQRLLGINGYADLKDSARLDVARYDLELVAACLETGNDTRFMQFIQARTDERIKQELPIESRLRVLIALEEILLPLVTTVEAATFLWRALAQTRTILSHMMLKEIARPESEEGYRDLFENANDLIQSVAPDGSIQYVNRAWRETLGYSEEEISNLSLFDVIHPDSLAHCMEMFQRVMAGEVLDRVEATFVSKDGRAVAVEGSVSCRFEGGDPVATRGIFRDVTERKRMEEELKASEEKFRAISASAQDAIIMIDNEGYISFWNEAAGKILGYSHSEALGQELHTFIAPQRYYEDFRKGFARHKTTGKGAAIGKTLEVVAVRKDGTELPIELSLSAIKLKGEWNTIGIVRDIAERKRIEGELKTSEERFRSVVQTANDAIISGDSYGNIIFWNPAAEDLFGYSADEALGKPLTLMVSQQFRELHESSIGRTVESIGIRKDGAEFPIELSLAIWQKGEDAFFTIIVRDITDRKGVEEAVRESEERFRRTFEVSAIGKGLMALDGQFYRVNDSFCQMFGYTEKELLSKKISDITHPDDRAENHDYVKRLIEGKFESDSFALEKRYVCKDGRIILGRINVTLIRDRQGRPLHLSGELEDFTERRRLEQEIRESLERRARQVQTSTEIAQEIAAAPALDELFRRVVTLIKERFGYYHAQIFRPDPERKAMMVIEGYGETGEKMKAAGHNLPYDRGVVGTAATTGEPVLASDVSQNPYWLPHPDLPDTEGELAVPIKLRDKVLGVLDVQSDTVGALTEEDQIMLLGLAGQIAIAIEETRLRQETEENLRELERLTRTMSREGWEVHRREAGPIGYLFDQSDVIPADDFWAPEIGLAMERKALAAASTSGDRPIAATPLLVRGEIIGALGVRDDPQRPLSQEDLALVESVSEQVAQALESARLLDQTQTVLTQTETLYAGSERVVRATTMDEVLQAMAESTALHRLGRASILFFDRPWVDERPETLIVSSVWTRGDETPGAPTGTRYALERFPAAYLLNRDEPTILRDVAADGRVDRNTRALLLEQLDVQGLVAFPLVIGGQWAGFISGESSTVLEISEDEIRQIASMADQAAIVIQNLRLLDQTRAALEEAAATHRLYLRERWSRFVPARVAPLHERTQPDVAPLGDVMLPEVEQAMAQREVVVQSSGDDGSDHAAVVAPIKLRGEVIGALGLHEMDGGRRWTDDEVALIESVADQIALAIENVRLLEETQRRAQRERLVADITAKVRSSSDMETILRTAVRELGAALGTDRAFIRLGAGTRSAEE